MNQEIHPEQLSEMIEQLVRETLAFADVISPPVDAFVVAVRLGLTVARDQSHYAPAQAARPRQGPVKYSRARLVKLSAGQTGLQESASQRRRGQAECGEAVGMSPSSERQSLILLAEEDRRERRHWAVAHEIGEHLASEVFARLGQNATDAPPATRESVANRLASSLLLPRQWYRHDGVAHDWQLLELKKLYATASHELLARRMLDMPQPVLISVFDHGRLQWRRGSQGVRAGGISPAELVLQRECHLSGEPRETTGTSLPEGVARLRAWPVHESQWKREIVRTELHD